MIRLNQALCGLILLLVSLPGFGQSREAAPELEYASIPAHRPAAESDAAPTSRPRAAAKPRRSSPSTATSAGAASAPVTPPTAPPESLVPALDEPALPPWRVTALALLTPFGINAMLAKVGMSGAPADILGLILLALLALVLLLITFKLIGALRYRIADRLRQKQFAPPEPKREPVMKPKRPRDSSNSRLNPNSRGGPHTRPSPRPEPRMGGHSQLGPETRAGQGQGLRQDSRIGPESRLGGDTRFENSRMGPETRAMNPVLQKKEVQNAPENFDQPRFLRKARVYFLRLQLAWDKSDLNSIRQFATTPIFNELRKQILERGDTTNNTDVLSIQTELLGIEITGNNYVASVKFSGMIKESQSPTEEPFEEVWNLSLPVDKKGDWVLSGIAQY